MGGRATTRQHPPVAIGHYAEVDVAAGHAVEIGGIGVFVPASEILEIDDFQTQPSEGVREALTQLP
jgi:hypothetical protein